MNIEQAIDIIDKELHKKWDKKVHKDNNGTHIILSEEVPLNEFEIASQRCLVEVQRLNNIINKAIEYIEDYQEVLKDHNGDWLNYQDGFKPYLLALLEGADKE